MAATTGSRNRVEPPNSIFARPLPFLEQNEELRAGFFHGRVVLRIPQGLQYFYQQLLHGCLALVPRSFYRQERDCAYGASERIRSGLTKRKTTLYKIESTLRGLYASPSAKKLLKELALVLLVAGAIFTFEGHLGRHAMEWRKFEALADSKFDILSIFLEREHSYEAMAKDVRDELLPASLARQRSKQIENAFRMELHEKSTHYLDQQVCLSGLLDSATNQDQEGESFNLEQCIKEQNERMPSFYQGFLFSWEHFSEPLKAYEEGYGAEGELLRPSWRWYLYLLAVVIQGYQVWRAYQLRRAYQVCPEQEEAFMEQQLLSLSLPQESAQNQRCSFLSLAEEPHRTVTNVAQVSMKTSTGATTATSSKKKKKKKGTSSTVESESNPFTSSQMHYEGFSSEKRAERVAENGAETMRESGSKVFSKVFPRVVLSSATSTCDLLLELSAAQSVGVQTDEKAILLGEEALERGLTESRWVKSGVKQVDSKQVDSKQVKRCDQSVGTEFTIHDELQQALTIVVKEDLLPTQEENVTTMISGWAEALKKDPLYLKETTQRYIARCLSNLHGMIHQELGKQQQLEAECSKYKEWLLQLIDQNNKLRASLIAKEQTISNLQSLRSHLATRKGGEERLEGKKGAPKK